MLTKLAKCHSSLWKFHFIYLSGGAIAKISRMFKCKVQICCCIIVTYMQVSIAKEMTLML